MVQFYFAGLLLLLNVGFGWTALEPVLSVCKQSNLNLEQCVMDVIDRIRPNLASGKYGSDKVHPSLEPVVFDQIGIQRGPSFSVNFTNLNVFGSSKFVIKKLKIDAAQRQINGSVIIPQLDVNGKYGIDLSILLLRISGKGDMKATLNDSKAIVRMEYYFEKVGDQQLARFKPIEVKLKFDKAFFQLSNLFNGDPTLERVGNEAINQNPQVLLDEIKQTFEENLSRKFTELANSLVQNSTPDDIFPE